MAQVRGTDLDMGTPYAFRRGLTFFLKLRVPSDLAPYLGTHIVRTLRTTDARIARERAAAVAASAGSIWSVLRKSAMVKVLGKDLEELTGDDISRGNLDKLWADIEPLGADDRQQVFTRIEAIIAGLEGRVGTNRYIAERVQDELDAFREGQRSGSGSSVSTSRARTRRTADRPACSSNHRRAGRGFLRFPSLRGEDQGVAPRGVR